METPDILCEGDFAGRCVPCSSASTMASIRFNSCPRPVLSRALNRLIRSSFSRHGVPAERVMAADECGSSSPMVPIVETGVDPTSFDTALVHGTSFTSGYEDVSTRTRTSKGPRGSSVRVGVKK